MVTSRAERREIAAGIHQAIVKRSVAMLQRITIEEELIFTGGVALNPCIK